MQLVSTDAYQRLTDPTQSQLLDRWDITNFEKLCISMLFLQPLLGHHLFFLLWFGPSLHPAVSSLYSLSLYLSLSLPAFWWVTLHVWVIIHTHRGTHAQRCRHTQTSAQDAFIQSDGKSLQVMREISMKSKTLKWVFKSDGGYLYLLILRDGWIFVGMNMLKHRTWFKGSRGALY